jgi:hypothetical protein
MRNLTRFSGVIAIALIAPQIAFAAWWNPISWFKGWSFFHRTDTQTQVLENRVKELEKKLENAATSTAVTATTTEQSQVTKRPVQTTPVTSVGTKNTATAIETPIVNQPILVQSTQPIKDYENVYVELTAKYIYMRDVTVHNNILLLEESTVQDTIKVNYSKFLYGLEKNLNDDIGGLGKLFNVKPKPVDTIDYYASRYFQFSKQYDDEIVKNNNESKRLYKTATLDYVRENQYSLYIPSIHIETARLLDLFDRAFGSKYYGEFKLTKTQQETIEFANSFILDMQLNKW